MQYLSLWNSKSDIGYSFGKLEAVKIEKHQIYYSFFLWILDAFDRRLIFSFFMELPN